MISNIWVICKSGFTDCFAFFFVLFLFLVCVVCVLFHLSFVFDTPRNFCISLNIYLTLDFGGISCPKISLF